MRSVLGLLALSTLTGCLRTSASWEGLWLVKFPAAEANECELEIDENFLDAAPPEEVEIEEGDWTYEVDGKVSDGAQFMQVLMDGGLAVGVIGGTVYTGTADAKALTLTWEGSEDTEDLSEHSSGYEYVVTERSSSVETLTLNKGKKGAYSGTFEFKTNATVSYLEVDEWDSDEVGFNGGEIPGGAYLEGDMPNNRFDSDDCSGGDCELTISQKCDSKLDITAQYAGSNEGMFNGVEDASRPNGVEGY